MVFLIEADGSGPLWTDQILAWATLVGVIGGVLTLAFAYLELRDQTAQGRQGIEIRLAQRALDLMRLLIDIERVAVERPHLAPYLQAGKAIPEEGDLLRDEVLAYGLLFSDFAETVGWQIRVNQMSKDSAIDWRHYFKVLLERSPALQCVVEREAPFLAAETLWLFGQGSATGPLQAMGITDQE